MTQPEKDIFGRRSIFIPALLFLMKPDDKDLSFKASLWFWITIFNYFLQVKSTTVLLSGLFLQVGALTEGAKYYLG